MDGVLTATSKLHAAAWKETFDAYLQDRSRDTFVPFDPVHDYERYVDGRLRADGVRSFLSSRGLDPARGDVADAVELIARRKDEAFSRLLASRGVETFDGSVRYVRAVRAAGLRTAVVSSSKHCRAILGAAKIAELFEVIVDGDVVTDEHLSGKPAPDAYVAAALKLGVPPSRAAVFEDALAGVAAGRAGGFGFVVGVDRLGQAEELRGHGADVVVTDLSALLERS
jgi:beta-phosphoglucomutase family hydrolase